MTSSCRAILAVLALVASTVAVQAQQPSQDPRVADVVRAGKIRIGLHLPQFVKDPATGEIHGHGTGTVIEPIAEALGKQMGVKVELVGNPSPPKLIECLDAGQCDAGFLGFVKSRIDKVGYTAPYLQVPFTMLVSPSSQAHTIADLDRKGVRIAAVRNHASTIALKRVIKEAEIVEVDIPDQAFELVRSGGAEAYASPRPPILAYARKLAGSRVLDDRYGANLQSMAVAKTQTERLAYISEFLEGAKESGLVQQVLDRTGARGMEVAPAAKPPVVTGSVPGAKK
jgi:polar amino acid transport system substrate-binding protein